MKSAKHLIVILAVTVVTVISSAQVEPRSVDNLEYDVVSIKVHNPMDHSMNISIGQDQFHGSAIPVVMLVQFAYQLSTADKVVGIKGPVSSNTFDIEAKFSDQDAAHLRSMDPITRARIVAGAMRKTLESRFGLVSHKDVRVIRQFDMLVDGSGRKGDLHKVSEEVAGEVHGAPEKLDGRVTMTPGVISGQGVSMDMLAASLGGLARSEVNNKTKLTGLYNFELRWSDDLAGRVRSEESSDYPSVFTALHDQLGLKVVPVKATKEIVIVVQMKMPSAN